MHILVTGASGSGTSTLGQALAGEFELRFVDADDIYWLPTKPAFREKRDAAERLALLRDVLVSGPAVIAGSIMGWDSNVEDSFDLIVFLTAPAEVRVSRLRERELARFGHVNEEFIAWAAQYDVGTMEGRNLNRHLAWLAKRHCPVVHLVSTVAVGALVAAVRAQAPNPFIERTAKGPLRGRSSAAHVRR